MPPDPGIRRLFFSRVWRHSPVARQILPSRCSWGVFLCFLSQKRKSCDARRLKFDPNPPIRFLYCREIEKFNERS